ncbi:MAG: DNA-processing protein DprA [Clostridia bacterium]|nr:DNA-processing protein DprA [Clostridia bacterium]
MNYDSIDIYELWLGLKLSSARRCTQLIGEYGNAKTVFENIESVRASHRNIITDTVYDSLCSETPEALHERLRRSVVKLKIDVIMKSHAEYPKLLKQCDDSPSVLFVRGRLPKDDVHTVGIVGTRNYSSYGAEVTDAYAHSICKYGGVTVSGLAMGIDTVVAKSSLRASDNECATVAVLGSGIDIPTPDDNAKLYYSVIERGAVVSQFAPGVHATRYTYPMRNKVIAGMSEVLIVTEAGERSGALITARAAINYNRKVYCVPGRMVDASYAGSNALLQNREAEHIPDVENFYRKVFLGKEGTQNTLFDERRTVISSENKPKVSAEKEQMSKTGLDEAEEKIYNALKQGEKSFEELCSIIDISAPQMNLKLTMMELSGIIVQMPGRIYKLHI